MILTEEDYLEHYGKKGMKWGVRKGRGTTGISRTRGAAIDRNKRMMSRLNKVRAGKKHRVLARVGKAYLGQEKFQRVLKQDVSELNHQNERLRKGKLTIEDRIDLYRSTTVAGLLISRTPRD